MDWYVDHNEPAAIPALRHEVDGYLRRHAADGDGISEAVLIVDELVSNAIRHAGGDVWVSLEWSEEKPTITVEDLGPDFELAPSLPDDLHSPSGRGLFLVSHLADDLRRSAKRAGGNRVTAVLPVGRPVEQTFAAIPESNVDALPHLSQASQEGFPKEPFLLALAVQLARAVERQEGPTSAQEAVSFVGVSVGQQMEAEYRRARGTADRLTADQLADCLVRLKAGIGGDFYVIEASDDRIVLGNRRCPFGDDVQRAPSLCRMTSSVFGGIAARNHGAASVVLEERIAVGDPECRVVVHLGEAPVEIRRTGHHYRAPART